MSDFFEERQRDDIFQQGLLGQPEGYKPNALPTSGWNSEEARQRRNEYARRRREFREEMQAGPDAGLSPHEYGTLFDMREKGLIDDDDVCKMVSSKELGQYLGLPPTAVFEFYDEIWQAVSEDRENRHAPPMSREKAVIHSVRMAENMEPLGRLGLQLRDLNTKIEQAGETEREALRQQADDLWGKITEIQKANDALARGMPTDALTTIYTSTIQSAPFTGKAVAGGVAGGLIIGAAGAIGGAAMTGGVGAVPGFARGWKTGYTLGSFLASSAEMTGLMYVDLLAAGVEEQNARQLAAAGGAINGFIESKLGAVAAAGKSAGKAIGGKVLTEAARKRIAEDAGKRFIKKMSGTGLLASLGKNAAARTALETGKEVLGEGLEELFQFFVEQSMLALGDSMQDSPVARNLWGSPGFQREMKMSLLGGLAGGLGFGIATVPLTVKGVQGDIAMTAWETARLKDLAVTIDDPAEFISAVKESKNPMAEGLPDEQLMKLHDSQKGARGKREREEARAAEELEAAGGIGEGFEERKVNKDTGEEIPLDKIYRRKNGRLYTQLDEKRGLFKIGDGSIDGRNNLYAYFGYELGGDGKTVRVKKFEASSVRPELNTEEFRQEAWSDFTEAFAGLKPVWEAETTHDAEIIAELKKNNPYGDGLNYYPEALNENIADEVVDTAAKGDTAQAARMKLRFGEQMARHLPVSTEASRSGTVRLIDRIGRAYGYTFDQFIKKLRLDPENIFTHEPNKAVLDENAKAAQFAKEGETPQKVRGALQPWKRLDADIKAVQHSIIYLDPEGAGLSTVLHELKHAVDNFLEKSDPKLFKRMMDAAGEYDPKNSGGMDENTWRRERSAYAWETYLQTGEAPTAELRSLFQQMKEWLKEIIEYIDKGLRKLSPKQKEVFDELLSKADKAAADWEASESARIAQEGQAQASAANDAAGGAEGRHEAATAQYEANKKPHEERDALQRIAQEGQAQAAAENGTDAAKVQHDGEYVLTSAGGRDFGEIPAEIGQAIRRQAGAIRLRAGEQDAKTGKGYGEKHIERPERLKQIKGIGFNSARDFVEFVASNYDSIYEAGGGSLHILHHGKYDTLLAVKLEPSEGGDYYDVKTGFVARKGYIKEKPLWERTQGGLLSDQERANTNQQQLPPNADSGRSGNINIPQTGNDVKQKKPVDAENEKRVAKARERWDKAKKIYGAEDQITLPNGEIWGVRHVLGEADAASGSVDAEQNFAQSERFPVNEDGTTQNVGRDYTEGFAREAIDAIAAGFDQRGDGIIVDTNGVVLSGNNRKTSREVAAKKGTDGKYVNYLKLRPDRWGLTQADIAEFKHPTHYLEVRAPAVYTPHVFDIFNRSGEKSTSPLETAVKMSYLIDQGIVNEFSLAMGNYDSISELYEDTQAATKIFKSLMKRGIITENSYPEYVETVTIKGRPYERVTSNGKEFLESVMLGAALNTDSIRLLALATDIRKRVVKGLAALVDNAALGEYCVVPEINQAISIAVEVSTNKKKYKGIADYADQAELELGQRVSTDIEVELAGRLLERTEYGFADMMVGLNAVLEEEARGQSDMFSGASKDGILRRYLNVKAKYDSVREANDKVIESGGAPMAEKAEAALDNAGLAREEAGGALFQAAYNGSPHRFDRFDSSHIGSGEGNQTEGYGLYFSSKKEVAEWYRIILNFKPGAEIYVDGVKAHVIEDSEINNEDIYFNAYHAALIGELDNRIQVFEKEFAAAAREDDFNEMQRWGRALEQVKKLKGKKVELKSGQLYEVDIPGDEDMLDWDNLWEEQPEKTKHAISNALNELFKNQSLDDIFDRPIKHVRGNKIYYKLSDKLGSDKAASEYLNSIGIKGIRYLDGSSRAAGEGSHNYVIFDDSDINITQTFFQTGPSYGWGHHIESENAVWYKDAQSFEKAQMGQPYEVKSIDDNVLLLWDKPLSEQPEAVKKAVDKLLTWKGDGRSNFHYKYNIRRLVDGYGLYKPVNGKIKFNTLDEAKAAAKVEIKDSLTGKSFYDSLAEAITPEKTSGLLDRLGVRGSKYLKDKKRGAEGAKYNYVLYGGIDSGAYVEQTFFQLDDQLVEEAAGYDSWQEFRDAYEPAVQISRRRREDSVMPRQADNFAEAEKAGKEFAGKELTNRQTGMAATVSNKTLGKMLSVSASDKSVSPQVHALAVANVDRLYERAELLGSHDDEKQNENIERIHRFGVVMQHNGEFYPVKITVKEFKRTADKSRIYTVEAVDIEKEKPAGQLTAAGKSDRLVPIADSSLKPAGQLTNGLEEPDRNVPIAGFTDKLIQMVDSVKNPPPIPSGADNAWYRSLWNDAQKIHDGTYFQEEEKTSRAEELDKRFYRSADMKYLTKALIKLHRINNDQTLEPVEEEGGAAHEDYRRVKRLQHRISTELPYTNTVLGFAAQANSAGSISSGQYGRLKGYMSKRKRDFRAVFADIMGQEEYLEDLAETKDGEPAGRLADPRPDKQDSKERLKEIAEAVRESDPALAKEIEDGTVRYDDPRIAAFEAGAESEYRESKAAMDALKKETAEDFARLANDAGRQIVTAWEDVIAARVRADETDKRLRRWADEEGKIAEPYLKRLRLEKAGYEQAYKAYNALVDLYGKDADVREAIARREAKAAEKERLEKIYRKRRAAKALREMKLAHLKRITRRVKFENVAYEQAVIIKAVQRIFLPSIIETGDRFVGTIDGPLLRQVWGCWQTDEEYREKMRHDAKTPARAEKLEALLEKPWDFLTRKEKQQIIKLVPKPTVTSFLNLREMAAEYKEDAQLDIEEKVVNGEAHLIVGEELEAKVKEAIGEEAYRRIRHKPLAEWTPGELEELARAVDGLAVEGRRIAAAKREADRAVNERYRNLVLATIKTGNIKVEDDDTPEEKERKKKALAKIAKEGLRYNWRGKKNIIFANDFIDANIRRQATAWDGGRKGVFNDLFYWMENDAYNQKEIRMAARRLLVETVMKEQGVKLDELFRKMEIPLLEETALFEASGKKLDHLAQKLGLPESTWSMDALFEKIPKSDLTDTPFYRLHKGEITVDELLYIMRGAKNEHTRQAVVYGVLSSAAERKYYEGFRTNETKTAEYEGIGHYRLARILAFAGDFFSKPENKKFLAMAEAIGEDYDRNGETLNRACLDMFGRPMWRVENYVRMNRLEHDGSESEYRVVEDLLGIEGAGIHSAFSGFKEKRIDMSPYYQKPVKLGLYETWAQSVQETEHFMAYGPVVRRLNAVFKGHEAGVIREAMHGRWGEAAVKRVDDTIAEYASPDAGSLVRSGMDKVLRLLRGKTATAFLAGKISALMKQMVTSPWPYLQEIGPAQYLAACVKVAAGMGKVNDFIKKKAIFMNTRGVHFDPMVKLIREALEKNEHGTLYGINKVNATLMKVLEWVDWIWVAPGWLAVYERELANVAKEQEAEYQKLLKKYQGSEYSDVLPTIESKENKAMSEIMNEEQQDYEAAARADDAVRLMQPSGRPGDIAPLYKGRNEAANLWLQFTMAQNQTVWQQLRYDLPLAVKEKQAGRFAKIIISTLAAGACMGLLAGAHLPDDDDDDEEGAALRRMLFYMFSQGTDAMPLIGEGVTRLAELGLTGKTSYPMQQNVLPVLQKAYGGGANFIRAVQEENPEKRRERYIRAVQDTAEAAGIGFGLPVSGAKELGRAFGIGDGDGELEFYWQALLGQRKK